MRLLKKLLKPTLRTCLFLVSIIFVVMIFCHLHDTSSESAVVNYDIPVILWWTSGFPGTSETRKCHNNVQCVVSSNRNETFKNVKAYMFYGSGIKFDDLPLPRKPGDVIWGLYHEESPRNVEELMHENILNLFNFSSTFSRHSDVSYPLQYLGSANDITTRKYYVETSKKNSLLNEVAPIMYLQSDCETSTERDEYVKELMKLIRIDSYGECLRNKEMPVQFRTNYLSKLNDDDFLNFIARYKFVIAIENGICDDYVTEKFWRAIKVGTVPIYYGSPKIKDWFPNNKSAILLEDYKTPEGMKTYIEKLLGDDTLYEEYLDHKTLGIVSNQKLIKELKDRAFQHDALAVAAKFECFVCEKIHENVKGRFVNKSHYNCPKPISALTLNINPSNSWVYSYEAAKRNAKKLYKKIMNS